MADQAAIGLSVGNMTLGGWTGNAITPLNQGWSCPKCGSAHAPHVQTCPQSWGLNYPLYGGCAPAAAPNTVTCGQGTIGLQQALSNVHPPASQGYSSGSIGAK